MTIPAGTYRLGPDDGTLSLRTGRNGAAAKAGHDLLIHATSWEAHGHRSATTPAVAVDVDGGSLRVIEGTGGMMALTDEHKAEISTTIDDQILKRRPITFRSTRVEPASDGTLRVEGELTLLGTDAPDRARRRGRRRRPHQRRPGDHAERLGHQALLDAVRHAEGRTTRSRSPSTPACRRPEPAGARREAQSL